MVEKISIAKRFTIGDGKQFVLICGPCVIEGEEACFEQAASLKELCARHGIPLVFKASYDKANRSSIESYRGPGVEEGLRILSRIREELDLPIMTDVHTPEEARLAGDVCDILQLPAFLIRQTDLLVAAGETGCVVHAKKGQFMAPWDMEQVVKKLLSTGNRQIILSDRGTSFGYNNLVSDMRSIPVMRAMGFPVSFDASHSVQLPGGLGDRSGGQREFVPLLARCALMAGADTLYIEAHPDPVRALSDAATMPSFAELDELLPELIEIHQLVQQQKERRRCSGAKL